MSLDIPMISSWSNKGRDLVKSLSESVHAQELEVYDCEALKMLINYYFRTASEVIYMGYLIPKWI